MALTPVDNPFGVFLGLDGRPLNGGKVYIGLPNEDPETDPQQVWWTDDGSGPPAFQPLQTISGYVANSGAPARFWTGGAYSIRVRDRQNNEVFYAPNVEFELPDGTVTADSLTDDPGEIAAITDKLSVAHYSLSHSVNVMDFIPSSDWAAIEAGTYVGDLTANFMQAIDTGRGVYLPSGCTYPVALQIERGGVRLFSDVSRGAVLVPPTPTDHIVTIDGDAAGEIITRFEFEKIEFRNPSRSGHGIYITNSADTRGCDRLLLRDVFFMKCQHGLSVQGRSIWNSFDNVQTFDCYEGIHVETDQACNAWGLSNIATSYSVSHGMYVRRIGGDVFKNWTFSNFNAEANGIDLTDEEVCGLRLENIENFSIDNYYLEQNGPNHTTEASFGLHATGNIVRGLNLSNGWAVDSKFPVYISGNSVSGRLNGLIGVPTAGNTLAVVVSALSNIEEPKFEVDAKSVIGGEVVYIADVNGNYAAAAMDYVASPGATLDFTHIDALTVNTASPVLIEDIIGVQPGRMIAVSASGVSDLTIAAGLMASGSPKVISSNTAARFLVSGYPNAGKLLAV